MNELEEIQGLSPERARIMLDFAQVLGNMETADGIAAGWEFLKEQYFRRIKSAVDAIFAETAQEQYNTPAQGGQ